MAALICVRSNNQISFIVSVYFSFKDIGKKKQRDWNVFDFLI